MIDSLRRLCDQLATMDLDATAFAARVGTIEQPTEPGLPVAVVPFDKALRAARVISRPDSATLSSVVVVPADRPSIAELNDAWGPYEESPRLHPDGPRKLVFSPPGAQRYVLRVIAEIGADETIVETAAIERIIITRSLATEDDQSPTAAEQPIVAVWPGLRKDNVSFGLRSWRDAALDDARDEIESSLGVRLVPSHDRMYDGRPAFESTMPTCELRLSAWPSGAAHVQVFSLIGEPPVDVDAPDPRRPEDIGDAVATLLRSQGHDWYVPDQLEFLEEAGLLRDRQLDRDVIVAILAARWLAWCDAEERQRGIQLLESIVEMWLFSASHAADPVADLKERRREFEGWGRGVRPRGRLNILSVYAVQEQLSIMEHELFELQEMSDADRSSDAAKARLAALQDTVPAMAALARQVGVTSVARQYERVQTGVDALVAKA
jgi:hypothetical protein